MNFDFRVLSKKYFTAIKYYGNESNVNLPGALPVTVNLGLFVEKDGLNSVKSVNALNLTLLKIDSILLFTPHKFRFLIPISYGYENNTIKKIFSCNAYRIKRKRRNKK